MMSGEWRRFMLCVQRPKRRPLKDFFTDEEDSVLESTSQLLFDVTELSHWVEIDEDWAQLHWSL